MTLRLTAGLIPLVVCAACQPAGGGRANVGPLSITYAMVPAPGTDAEAAAYLMIQNRDTVHTALTSARSADADSVVLYSSAITGDHPVARIDVPSRTRVQLAPGTNYLQLRHTHHVLATGDTVVLELRFEPGGTLAVRAPVVPFIAAGAGNDLVWWCAALAAAGDNRMELAYFWASILLVLLPTSVFGTIGYFVARAAYRHNRAEQAARQSAV